MDNVGIVTARDIGYLPVVGDETYFPVYVNSNEPQGLSNGLIIAIVLGIVAGILSIIVCMCCLLIQVSRKNAAKFALGEEYRSPYSGETPASNSDDPWERSGSYNSLDRREYAVGQAVERFWQDHDSEKDNGQFQTPYIVGGDDNVGVERNYFTY
eukprot:XP_011666343.1 PREDICTED: uncharacterized protein LOC105439251 [Strongylocentrotus purpuratus]